MELSDTSFGDTKVPWNSMECSMEFHGTKWYVIWRHQSSMEFHGILWNTCVICNGALLIPWNPMELGDFLFGHSRVPRNSMVYPIEVHDNMVLIKMTLNESQSSMEFHGTEWYCIWRHQSSMEFHGIRWNLVIAYLVALEFHGISCHSTFHGTYVVSLNSMELLNWLLEFHGIWLCSQIPWNF